MTLKIQLIEPLRKGTIKREQLKAEIAKAKEKNALTTTYFLCHECGLSHPLSERGLLHGGSHANAVCKACKKKSEDGKTAKAVALRKSRQKSAQKRYKNPNAKYPRWMFS